VLQMSTGDRNTFDVACHWEYFSKRNGLYLDANMPSLMLLV